MIQRPSLIAVALALSFAASWSAPAPRADIGDVGRALVRPFLLPGLWRELREATILGDPAAALAAGRLIAELLPDWVDAQVDVAWRAGADLAREEPDRDRALAMWVGAIDELDRHAGRRAAAGHHTDAVELWFAAATLAELRAVQDPDLAARSRERLGRDPTEWAYDLIHRAREVASSTAVVDRLAVATVRMIAAALRMGDAERAEAFRNAALVRLEELGDDAARATRDGLSRLGSIDDLLRDPMMIADLADDPWLGEIAAAAAEWEPR